MQDPEHTQPSKPSVNDAEQETRQQVPPDPNLAQTIERSHQPPPQSLDLTQKSAAKPPSYQPPMQATPPPPQPVAPVYGYQAPPPPPTQAPKRKRRGKKRGCMPGPGCLAGCMGFVSVMAVALVLVGIVAYYQLSQRLDESIDDLETSLSAVDDPTRETGFESTFIYDRDGNQLWEIFGKGRRQRVSLDEIPDWVLWATISVEDDDFYANPGFDVRSNIRAVTQYIQEGYAFSGASTITQQLVRNVVFDPEYRREVSVQRKLEEISLAVVLTQRMSKDDILELYLNTIYYGNLAYGIEAASQAYFGKNARDLDLHEAALLAGLPQLPSIIDPLNPDPDIQAQVIDRQHLILDLMVKEEYITEDEARLAKSRTLNYVSPEVPLQAPHFTLYAIEQLEDLAFELGQPPEFITDGGLRVYTSVDLDFQAIAQRAAERHVNQLRDRHNLTNASVVVLHPPSGEILAMVGSVDYNNELIDGQVNVSVAMRQPGSTVKPFTYAAAMEQGMSPAHIFWDVETDFPVAGQADYTPLNYDRRFHGAVRMRDALANSYNVPAVLAMDYIGVEYLINFLRRMGTQSLSQEPGRYGLSLTLGGGEMTLLELSSNYATLAREGVYVPPQAILCIVDKNDNVVYQYEDRCPEGNSFTNQSRLEYVGGVPVIDPRIAFIVSDMLSDNAARTPAMGANSPLNTGNLLTSVKTGTTDNFRDNWTVGYTRDIAVGVWSGNSDNSEMIDVSGLVGAAPIWNDVITTIYRQNDMPPSVLNPVQSTVRQEICNLRGMSDPVTNCNTYQEWFLQDAPLVPDGQGNLTRLEDAYPQPTQAPDFGPIILEREPGIMETYVRPLNDAQKQVAVSQNPAHYATPKYCLVPVEVLESVPDARPQLFIKPPESENNQRSAYRYALNANIPILPQFPCTQDTIVSFGPVPVGTTGQIVSPTSGQTVSGVIPIYGVVDYPDGLFFDYYKLEVRGGPFADWTTMGQVHHNEVLQPDVLETFYAETLPPGTYNIRLWLQGENAPPPHEISINLVPAS